MGAPDSSAELYAAGGLSTGVIWKCPSRAAGLLSPARSVAARSAAFELCGGHDSCRRAGGGWQCLCYSVHGWVLFRGSPAVLSLKKIIKGKKRKEGGKEKIRSMPAPTVL